MLTEDKWRKLLHCESVKINSVYVNLGLISLHDWALSSVTRLQHLCCRLILLFLRKIYLCHLWIIIIPIIKILIGAKWARDMSEAGITLEQIFGSMNCLARTWKYSPGRMWDFTLKISEERVWGRCTSWQKYHIMNSLSLAVEMQGDSGDSECSTTTDNTRAWVWVLS